MSQFVEDVRANKACPLRGQCMLAAMLCDEIRAYRMSLQVRVICSLFLLDMQENYSTNVSSRGSYLISSICSSDYDKLQEADLFQMPTMGHKPLSNAVNNE